MTERAIEIRRAQMGLPSIGTTPSVSTAAGAGSQSSPAAASWAKNKSETAKEAALAALLSEDSQMERFINRLQLRLESNHGPWNVGDPSTAGAVSTAATNATTSASSTGFPYRNATGPTVPTALSRRMLQRQGVGYLDDTVAAVVSASGDRFLATILQQAVACRDQRLRGATMAKKAAMLRKRHMQHYEEDMDDRKRRKEAVEKAREGVALHTIAVAEAHKKGGGVAGVAATAATKKAEAAASAAATGEKSKNKRKKVVVVEKKEDEDAVSLANGAKANDARLKLLEEEEEEDYDSIDEEEEYYQEQAFDVVRGNNAGEDDDADEEDKYEEEDKTLLLRDIVRPLEAWDFHLTGKEAVDIKEEELQGEEEDALPGQDDEEKGSAAAATEDSGSEGDAMEENEIDEGMSTANGTNGSIHTRADNEGANVTPKKSSSGTPAIAITS
jgi:hypothetical protein